MEKQKNIWFRAKHYGWGWYPCTWQGWGVLFAWAVLFILSIKKINNELQNLIAIFIFTAVLIYICYKKGEKPAWHWGNK